MQWSSHWLPFTSGKRKLAVNFCAGFRLTESTQNVPKKCCSLLIANKLIFSIGLCKPEATLSNQNAESAGKYMHVTGKEEKGYL